MITIEQATAQLIQAGQKLYAMGQVPATSGNFSMRLGNGHVAITVSGRHKGELTAGDIMQVDMTGMAQDDRRPSAETLLHTQIYTHFPEARVVLHPHAMNAILLARRQRKLRQRDFIPLSQYELLKAFAGITTHEASMIVPVFDNDQNISRLAAKVQDYLDNNDAVYAYIIDGHGLYTWGEDMAQTLRYIEALDYLFACELQLAG